jgi:hypothetical protein
MDVFNGSKYCFTLLETVGLRVPNRDFREFSLFNVDFKSRNSPSAQCASTANTIDSDTDIFIGCSVSVSVINWCLILLLPNFINSLNLRSCSKYTCIFVTLLDSVNLYTLC